MASHLFDREIEAEKYKWEQSTTSWSAVQEDEEGNEIKIIQSKKVIYVL